MRVVSFSTAGGSAVGLRQGDSIIDISVAAPKLPRTIAGILAAGASAKADPDLPLSEEPAAAQRV